MCTGTGTIPSPREGKCPSSAFGSCGRTGATAVAAPLSTRPSNAATPAAPRQSKLLKRAKAAVATSPSSVKERVQWERREVLTRSQIVAAHQACMTEGCGLVVCSQAVGGPWRGALALLSRLPVR